MQADTVVLPVIVSLTYESTPCIKQKYEIFMEF